MNTPGKHYDAVVVGGGLSGLLAAATLSESGAQVFLIGKGGGYLHFTSGCVDVLAKDAEGNPVSDPVDAMYALARRYPEHPYALAGDALEPALDLFLRIMQEMDVPFTGTVDENVQLPTAIGSTRTTCLQPESMAAGDVTSLMPMLVAGFSNFRDFYPPYLAANLSRAINMPVQAAYLDLPQMSRRRHLLSVDAARLFDEPACRMEVARAVRAVLDDAERVGFPGFIGHEHSREAWLDLQSQIGVPVFEITTLPPSVPGIRVQNALRRWLLRRGVRTETGFWVTGRRDGSSIQAIDVESAGRRTRYTADAWILATGGVGGGGIHAASSGHLQETVFDLPVTGARDRNTWFTQQFTGDAPQPISLVGVATNDRLQPLLGNEQPLENVFITASNLPHWDPTREGSGEGVALATGYKAALGALAVLGQTVHTSRGQSPQTSVAR